MADWGPFDLSGKNAVVTGGAMGIGHGIVTRLVEAGANVVVADLDGAAAATVAGAAAGRGRAVPLAVDVGTEGAGHAMVSACVERRSAPSTSWSTTQGSTRWRRCWRPPRSCSTASTA